MITRWSNTSSNEEEFLMSALNGDKSRYHRARKQKIARRLRTRELLKGRVAELKSDGSSRKPRPVSE